MPKTHVPSATQAVDTLPPSVGERNSAARLTAQKVKAIRAAHAAGGRLSDLAAAFDVDPRTARHIVRRTTWVHVQ